MQGDHPNLAQHNGVQYLVYYHDGAQRIARSEDGFASVLQYGAQATGVITTATDQARAAVCKMRSAGRALVAVVPNGGALDTYVSRDDGYTWEKVT